jgi:hypothetical protein
MDGELLRWLYRRLIHDPTLARTRDCTYGDGVILLIYFFSVLYNRSLAWAHDRRNWPLAYRRLAFPSYSQLCRRVKLPRLEELIALIGQQLHRQLPGSGLKLIDGKPLPVGGFSKDKDATAGHVPDGFARGYRLHLVFDSLGRIEAFDATGLHAGEPTVAVKLLRRCDLRGCLIRGDSNYDSNPLYRRVARLGARLLAPRKKPFTGLGHHRHHPDRLRAIAELEQSGQTLREHRRIRATVERHIGQLVDLTCGLSSLPWFIRRLARVKRWVAAKVLLYHLTLFLRHNQACEAA